MKLDANDFKRLQWAIAFLVILTLIGAGSVWSVLWMQKSGQKALQEGSAARRDVQARLARARQEEQELRDKIDRFQALKTRGYIGPEHRLDWIEAIGRIKAARRIFKLDYEFAPQRLVDASILPAGAAAGGFEIMSSHMQLRVELLHEAELLAFLAELRGAVQAILHVRSCNIERLTPGVADRSSKALLKADCSLEWITLRESK